MYLPVLVASLLLTGCGGGQTDISGEVTFSGKTIASGRVTFIGLEGEKKVISAPIRRGKYTIKGCPVGPVKITVESFHPPKKDNLKGGAPKDLTKGFGPPPDDDPDPGAGPLLYVPIPERFASPDTSGLDLTVKPGTKEHNLTLVP